MISEQSWIASAFTLACLYSVLAAAIIYLFSSWASSIFSSLRQWRAFWLTALLCTVLPLMNGFVVLESTQPEVSEVFHESFSTDPMQVNSTAQSYVKLSNVAELMQEWLSVGVHKIAPLWLYLFAIGLLVQFLRHLHRQYRVLRVVNKAEKLNAVEALRINTLLKHAVDRRAVDFLQQKKLRILKTDHSHSPFVVSFPQPTLIISETALIELTDPQLALVLEHELVHLSNKDPLLTSLAGLVPILLWFNPYVHRLYQQFNLAVELNCDARVLEGRKEIRQQYLGAILAILNASCGSNLKLNNAAIGESTTTMLKTRLFCIQKPLPESRHQVSRVLALAIGLISFIAANTALQPSVVAQTSVAQTTVTQTTVSQTTAAQVTGAQAENEQTSVAKTSNAQTSAGVDALILQLQTQLPSAGARVSSKFGSRKDPLDGREVTHRGIDYAAAKGEKISATGDGQIIFAGEQGNYGNRIDIDHGDGVSTLYANLGEILVQQGQFVKQGETIALMGVSGRSTGPHVHYEIRKNGEPVCPSQHCLAQQ